MRISRSLHAGVVMGRGAVLALAMGSAMPAFAQVSTAPAIFPAPVAMRLTGPSFALGETVVLVRAKGVDAATEKLVREVLAAGGVREIRAATALPKRLDATYVVIGGGDAVPVRDALARTGAAVPGQDEGYALASQVSDGGALVVLAGRDGDGLYHAAQSFRQIVARGRVSSVTVSDYPAMPVRGTIEGFYGKPWSMAEREDHIAFLARFKANTYIYSPKDDVFARDKWREAYPADTLQALGKVVDVANREHVNFVYAISPGPTICYSDPKELDAVRRKFAALRGLGVRSFYVALDDIEYTKWNCAADEAAFGKPGQKAAAAAQASLLNAVQGDLAAAGHGSLTMVPTEYYNTTESPYKAELRKALDPRVVVQWTGTDTVPAAISVADAKSATKAFGRKTLLWDNYPVNDYGETAGRLLLAPYDRRQAGLSTELGGIVSNPMNQEVASRPAVAGVLAFSWNDRNYDAQRTWRAAAFYLAGGDAGTAEALLTFFDTQHVAPTFGHQPWQPQAPKLKALIDTARDALADNDPHAIAKSLAALGDAADALTSAPDRIRAGVIAPGFVREAGPWLDAAELWGRALRLTVDGLTAARAGQPGATRAFAAATELAQKAAAIRSIPGATRPEGPIKVSDGVLDRFIADAPGLVYLAPAVSKD